MRSSRRDSICSSTRPMRQWPFTAAHEGGDFADPAAHLAAGIEVLNDVLSGVPSRKDSLPRLLGKLSRAAPQGRRPKGHRQPYPQVASRSSFSVEAAKMPGARTQIGYLKGREGPRMTRSVSTGVIDTKTNQCRASRAGSRERLRAIRQYRRQGAGHCRHGLRLRNLRRLPSLPSPRRRG